MVALAERLTMAKSSTKRIPAGQHHVRVEFIYDGGGLGLGGAVTLYYDGKAVGNGRVEKT